MPRSACVPSQQHHLSVLSHSQKEFKGHGNTAASATHAPCELHAYKQLFNFGTPPHYMRPKVAAVSLAIVFDSRKSVRQTFFNVLQDFFLTKGMSIKIMNFSQIYFILDIGIINKIFLCNVWEPNSVLTELCMCVFQDRCYHSKERSNMLYGHAFFIYVHSIHNISFFVQWRT